ncbi:Phosphatidylinositol-5-phosphate 4-kinase type-2 beta [Myotis davidii]|uniref:Phosphatidylinositol 5-phosphate 4-kinase type-2 alpha n=1 Tax=Myotis davidii TaxID=225400 RepID=L5M5Y7_MYODS|nr:Phosphatidylinositol-5-phosphate 4-kinase type-2 beta [Myotis davidii]
MAGEHNRDGRSLSHLCGSTKDVQLPRGAGLSQQSDISQGLLDCTAPSMGLRAAAQRQLEHSQKQSLCWTCGAQGDSITVLDPDPPGGHQAQDFLLNGRETYMVVTRNMSSHQLTMHCKYDLKGSTVAREASDKEKGLLLGIHNVDQAEQEKVEVEEQPGSLLSFPRFFGPGEFDPSVEVYAMKSHESPPRKEVYFVAVTDIFTLSDAKKKAAHAAKTLKNGAGSEIETVNPEQYSKHFNKVMSNLLR